jgi:uncharacterized RDD family membrane protein YckC
VQYEDRITLATPEGVELDVALAGLGSRFAAALLDGIIQMFLIYGFGIAATLTVGFSVGPSSGDAAGWIILAVWFVWSFLVLFGYDIAFETLNRGRSIGKMAVGIRVVRVGGNPVGFVTSSVRNLLRIVDFLPLFYAVGIVSVLASQRNQRLGDMAAGTLVVRDPSRGAPKPPPMPHPGIYPPAQAPPAAAAPLDPSLQAWDVSMVSSDEMVAIRSFLSRRHTLDPGPRWNLAADMARRLQSKVSGAPVDLHPEVFLEMLYTAKSARS